MPNIALYGVSGVSFALDNTVKGLNADEGWPSMNELILSIIREQQSAGIPDLFERDLQLGDIQKPARGNLVRVIVGVRRCGKTYRLYQEMKRVIEAGYPERNLLYFNFEDERLKPYSKNLLDAVLEGFYTLNPNAREEGAFFFFDEIQEVPEWGTFLRRVVDTQKATIYVSGSSSKMLSGEVASAFRGRGLSRELFPMSFSEFLRFQGVQIPSPSPSPLTAMSGSSENENSVESRANARHKGRLDAFTVEERAQLLHWLPRYLERGGFIAVQSLETPDAVELLQSYANRTVNSDVIERYDVRSPSVALRFVSRCLASSGRELSINKIRNDFESRGVRTSRVTLTSLFGYYQEAYLIFAVNEFSRAIADNSRSTPKVYAIDQGMLSAFSKASTREEGQRLETAVFLKLRRTRRLVRDGNISRLLLRENGHRHEVDFIVGDALSGEAYQLIQACWSLTDEKIQRREVSALQAAMRKYHLEQGTIVTYAQRSVITVPEGTIRVEPAWSWLLD
ncbi:ATP-binding protein [Bifidobacterium bohemicum]|nr:ATP-binding protein [Bifidobacterium bohemicum]